MEEPRERSCGICSRKIHGQFVRVRPLNSYYHIDCFRCATCGQVVAEKFFPLTEEDGSTRFYCEKDYFARLDLLCARCGMALRGPHISALNKKYHLEHFTCSMCTTVLRQHDSYYEKDGEVFCQYHFSVLYASKCGGCGSAVLNRFVEMAKSGITQHWHPECYMIYKVRPLMLGAVGPEQPPDNLERVKWILSVLSSYEEAAADALSNILMNFTTFDHAQFLYNVQRFVSFLDALLDGLQAIEERLVGLEERISSRWRKEPKQLTRKMALFFSLLALALSANLPERENVMKEMVSVATSLAHCLKALIRIGLRGALKIEARCNGDRTLDEFLQRLNNPDAVPPPSFPPQLPPDANNCRVCGQAVEEDCAGFGWHLLHFPCTRCVVCSAGVHADEEGCFSDENGVYCPIHRPPNGRKGVLAVPKYTVMKRSLRISLTALMRAVDERGTSNAYNVQLASNVSRMKAMDTNETAMIADGDGSVESAFGTSNASNLLAEQLALDRLALHRKAIGALEKLFAKERVPMKEVLDKVSSSKTSMWNKMMFAMMPGKSSKAKGLQTEGIFRKNGNIRKLKDLADAFDEDPAFNRVAEEGPIQIAALLKKFLREMPDPLLTFKLYELFIGTQKLSSPALRKRALHCTVCLLPKPNLDLLYVLLSFLRSVSSENQGGGQNRMDLDSLATVIAPNILYPESNKEDDGGGMQMAIACVRLMLDCQAELLYVPPLDDV
ncbi:hypothetical protein HDU96_006734 [Phlyctochytrium bullatum]|nr:hypothetical protein HDU96_006734 [Phlyctochytrium bullatum]